MSSRNPVLWKEGLFIKPQHFQQDARASIYHSNQRLNSVSDYLYDFTELELNQEYLSFGKIAIVRARGIMSDGTVFDISNDLPPPPSLAITDISAVNQVVYLTLPLKSAGVLEVQWPDSYANVRYVAQSVEVKDTHSLEGDYVHMNLATLNLQLSLERDDRSAFTAIALGRILDKCPDGSLVLDEAFYPMNGPPRRGTTMRKAAPSSKIAITILWPMGIRLS